MKKEDLFKHMSELDDNLIAEAGEEGFEVKPIYVSEGKKRLGIKPAVVTAACCVLLAGSAAVVGGNYLDGMAAEDVETSAQTEKSAGTIVNDKNSDAYPESLKYRYTGDYSEFDSLGGVLCAEYPEYFTTYSKAEQLSKIVVVGEFVDDPRQNIDPDDTEAEYPVDAFCSCNLFRIDKILKNDTRGSLPFSVSEGDNIVISQGYAIQGNKVLSDSKLTPMLKGDRWVYFLDYAADGNVFYPLNDYMGRFPDPSDGARNRHLSAMTNEYGLTDANDFNKGIYRVLEQKLCPEKTPACECVYNIDLLDSYSDFYDMEFEMAEFENAVFCMKNGELHYTDDYRSSENPHSADFFSDSRRAVSRLYLYDLNGDGKREICAEIRHNHELGSAYDALAYLTYIYVWDYVNDEKYKIISDEYEYYLEESDGELIARKTRFIADGVIGEVVSEEKLSLNMKDVLCVQGSEVSFGHRGHCEYCLQDPEYCARQPGECGYRQNGQQNNGNSTQRSGHCEYCLQDAAYCAQQNGECPYRQDGHHNDELCIGVEKRGHYEYCLQDAAYCEQQEGECPYRHNNEHHDDVSSAERSGHCEYCLQDAEYCARQPGECTYRHDEHHGDVSSAERSGHCEYCLQDPEYCSRQPGECGYRQGSHHSYGQSVSAENAEQSVSANGGYGHHSGHNSSYGGHH